MILNFSIFLHLCGTGSGELFDVSPIVTNEQKSHRSPVEQDQDEAFTRWQQKEEFSPSDSSVVLKERYKI